MTVSNHRASVLTPGWLTPTSAQRFPSQLLTGYVLDLSPSCLLQDHPPPSIPSPCLSSPSFSDSPSPSSRNTFKATLAFKKKRSTTSCLGPGTPYSPSSSSLPNFLNNIYSGCLAPAKVRSNILVAGSSCLSAQASCLWHVNSFCWDADSPPVISLVPHLLCTAYPDSGLSLTAPLALFCHLLLSKGTLEAAVWLSFISPPCYHLLPPNPQIQFSVWKRQLPIYTFGPELHHQVSKACLNFTLYLSKTAPPPSPTCLKANTLRSVPVLLRLFAGPGVLPFTGLETSPLSQLFLYSWCLISYKILFSKQTVIPVSPYSVRTPTPPGPGPPSAGPEGLPCEDRRCIELTVR